jgi:hypothetical protein
MHFCNIPDEATRCCIVAVVVVVVVIIVVVVFPVVVVLVVSTVVIVVIIFIIISLLLLVVVEVVAREVPSPKCVLLANFNLCVELILLLLLFYEIFQMLHPVHKKK